MRFEAHVHDWEEMAKDPLRAILTGKREWDLDEFFATGAADADSLFAVCDRLGFPHCRDRALDFGCGVGRVTRHLAARFAECQGVDVSAQMLEKAVQYNPGLHFHLNQHDDLRCFADNHFDLVYSVLVLQHQPEPETIAGYIREFVRVLRPNGLLAFHLPVNLPVRYRLAPRRRAYKLLQAAGVGPDRLRRWGLFPMKMTAVPRERVIFVLNSVRARLLLAEPHGGSGSIPSLMYYCTKD